MFEHFFMTQFGANRLGIKPRRYDLEQIRLLR